jgi:cytochrome oxidase Cu insertion factor (SCO1/SenC/PrrC family)
MKRSVLLMMVFLVYVSLAAASSDSSPINRASGAAVKPGDAAPPFDLPTAAGATVALKDYKGKSKLVVLFYRGYW